MDPLADRTIDVRPPVSTATMAAVKRVVALPRGTVTFLLTDLQNSTRLWQVDPASMALAVVRHYEVVDEIVEACNGVRPEEQGEGDSIVAAFGRASDAVAAAVELQLALRREAWAGGLDISARMSVHTGEALLRDEANYAGSSIIRAARVRALAAGGQILVTAPTHDLVVDTLPGGWGLLDLGVHRLHNLDRPERVYQVSHPDLPAQFPALADALAARDLPAELTSFVGREDAIDEIGDLVAREALVTLTGAGGAGKTRLAMRVAHMAAARFSDGVWWVDLASLEDPALVPTAVRVALHLAADPDSTDPNRVLRHLRDRSTLLVLDNCEHLVAEVGDLVRLLIGQCQDLHVLATSRTPLGLAGETACRLPPLVCPPEAATLGALVASEAGRLFVERVVTARGESTLTDRDAPFIAAICDRLDGLPLAIELAAARARIMSPAEIARGLGDRFTLLSGGARTAEPRHRTLRASLEWSYGLLGERDRLVFTRLAVFAKSCTLESAAAVVADGQCPANDLIDAFSDLVDASMLTVRLDDQTRYCLPESVHEFAGTLLDEAVDRDALRARHAAWSASWVAQAALGFDSPDQLMWLERFDAEIGNVRAAILWARDRDPAIYASLVTGCAPYWGHRGWLHEARAEFGLLLGRTDLDRGVLARGAVAAARIVYRAGDLSTAVDLADDASRVARELGETGIEARALLTLGGVTIFQDPAAARALLREAEDAARASGDDPALIDVLQMVAWSHVFQDDLRPAERVLDDVAPLVTGSSPDRDVFQRALHGMCLVRRARFAEARALVEPAIGVAAELGDLTALAWALCPAMQAAQGCGDGLAYDAQLRHTLEEATESGSTFAEALMAMSLALQEVGAGRPEAGQAILDQHPLDESQGLSVAFMYDIAAAGASIGVGDWAAAREKARRSMEYARTIDSEGFLAMAMLVDAVALRFSGEVQAAESSVHEAMKTAVRAEHMQALMPALALAAGIALEHESYLEAVRILGATAGLCDRNGIHVSDFEEAMRAADLETARNAVGDDAVAAAWEEGTRLDLQELLEYVTRARGERKRPSAGWDSLTPRELAVVKLAAQGLTNPEIAERLFVGRGTVKSHLASVFTKLGVRTRAELAAEAVRRDRSDEPPRL